MARRRRALAAVSFRDCFKPERVRGTLRPVMPLGKGAVFAKTYEIVRPISAGGMGVVYEVIHLGTHRRRALKVMLANIVSDPRMRERFSLEAVITADIESENLTEIFDAGIDVESDCPFLVMELLRGEDLGARLKARTRTSGEETLLIVEQVCRALEKTHEKGIIHRDLKPDNLFLTKREDGSPRIKILDFGIAKLVRQMATSGAQATTKAVGTPYYMAREQITGESALIGPASDLYATAHIAFALLTGRPYFDDEGRAANGNVLALLMAVGRGATETASARALRRGVVLPGTFDAWFSRATALNPSERFTSARAFMDGLRLALGEPVGEVPGALSSCQQISELTPDNGVAARSDRPEGSLPGSQSHSSSREPFQQTGGPQSISAEMPALPTRKTSRTALLLAMVGLFGAIGVGFWRLSRPGPTEPTVAASFAAPTADASTVALVSVVLSGDPQPSSLPAVSVAAAALEPSTSASGSAQPSSVGQPASSRPFSKPALPRTNATKGEVWETR